MSVTMDAAIYRQVLERFSYSQEGFAKALGYSRRTGQRWATGEGEIPPAVAIIVRLLLARPEMAHVLADIAPMMLAGRKSRAGRKPKARPVTQDVNQ